MDAVSKDKKQKDGDFEEAWKWLQTRAHNERVIRCANLCGQYISVGSKKGMLGVDRSKMEQNRSKFISAVRKVQNCIFMISSQTFL